MQLVPRVPPHSGHTDRAHAKYSASGAKRWLNCHGSIALAAHVPPGVSSSYALDGTEAHELIEFCFTNGLRDADEAYRLRLWQTVDTMKPTVTWTYRHDSYEERIDAIQVMLDHCWEIIDAYHGCMVFIECEFPLSNSHGQSAGGTVDVAVYVPDLQLLYIIDYKHGAGTIVDSTEQLLVYAVTITDELWLKYSCAVIEAVLTIVQPRCFHALGPIRTEIVPGEKLDEFHRLADQAIGLCEQPGAPLKLGSWCKFCPAEMICPLRETQIANTLLPTFNSIKEISAVGLPDPKTLPLERITELLAAKDSITSWLASVEDIATELARNGTNIPGHKLVYAQAKSKWMDMDVNVLAEKMAELTGQPADIFKRLQPITITDAKALFKSAYKKGGLSATDAAARANEEIAFLTVKESSGNTVLVGLEDKRPAANVADRMVYMEPPRLQRI